MPYFIIIFDSNSEQKIICIPISKKRKRKVWEPVVSGVLFRLNGLGQWPNDLVRGRRHVRGRSTKVKAEIALQEELKVTYNRLKLVRGEKSPRKGFPRWFETFLSPWILL